MMPGFETEVAFLFEDARAYDLAQFEPDPEGHDECEEAWTGPGGDLDDAQWVVWPDAADESLWAALELRLYGTGPH